MNQMSSWSWFKLFFFPFHIFRTRCFKHLLSWVPKKLFQCISVTFSVSKNIVYNYSLSLWNKENVDLNWLWENVHIQIMFVFPSWILQRNLQIIQRIPVTDARNYLLFMFFFQMTIQSMNRSKIYCYFKNYFNVHHK